eukprot:4738112-Prymnesium_polylepis.1
MGTLSVLNMAGATAWSRSGEQGHTWRSTRVATINSPTVSIVYETNIDGEYGDAAIAQPAVVCGPALSPVPPSPPLMLPAQPPSSSPPHSLAPGDCMIVGFASWLGAANGQGMTEDSIVLGMAGSDFAIVLLESLAAGASISVTNVGWAYVEFCHSSGHSRHATHTAIVHEPAGTVLTKANFSGALWLDGTADQLIVYQGAWESPRFLCALDNSGGYSAPRCRSNSAQGGWHLSYCERCDDFGFCSGQLPCVSKYYSDLPHGLTEGQEALAFAQHLSWAYVGTTAGSPGELRTAIAQTTNWIWSDLQGASLTFVTAFDVFPESAPPPPSLPPSPPPPRSEARAESSHELTQELLRAKNDAFGLPVRIALASGEHALQPGVAHFDRSTAASEVRIAMALSKICVTPRCALRPQSHDIP